MEYIQDRSIVTAAMAAATYCGRAFNLGTRRWETLVGANMASGRGVPMSRYHIRYAEVRVYTSTGSARTGTFVRVQVCMDSLHTGQLVNLCHGIHGNYAPVYYVGDALMLAGLQWVVQKAGVVENDIVEIKAVYER